MLLIFMLLAAALFYYIQKMIFRKNYKKGLQVKINFQDKYIEEGASSVLKEVIENRKILPLPVVHVSFQTGNGLKFQSEENINITDNTSKREVFSVLWNQKITRKLPVIGVKRGRYKVKTADVNVYNFLMTDQYYLEIPQDTELYVYPKHIPTERLNILMQRIYGIIPNRERLYEDPLQFAGIREYAPGDDKKRINWKASAKAQNLMVNMYESSVAGNVTVFLDISDKGIWKQEKLTEEGIRLAAAISVRILKMGGEVAVYTNAYGEAEGKTICIPCGKNFDKVHEINRSMAEIKLSNGYEDLSETFQKATNDISKTGGIFLLISKNRKEKYGELLKIYAQKCSGSSIGCQISCMHIIPYHKDITGEEEAIPAVEGVREIMWEVES